MTKQQSIDHNSITKHQLRLRIRSDHNYTTEISNYAIKTQSIEERNISFNSELQFNTESSKLPTGLPPTPWTDLRSLALHDCSIHVAKERKRKEKHLRKEGKEEGREKGREY